MRSSASRPTRQARLRFARRFIPRASTSLNELVQTGVQRSRGIRHVQFVLIFQYFAPVDARAAGLSCSSFLFAASLARWLSRNSLSCIRRRAMPDELAGARVPSRFDLAADEFRQFRRKGDVHLLDCHKPIMARRDWA